MNDIFTYSQKNGSTIFTFPGRTKVLSTSPLNGGITTHLTHALNINCMNGDYECEMLGDTYEKDLMVHAQRLEINPQTATEHSRLDRALRSGNAPASGIICNCCCHRRN